MSHRLSQKSIDCLRVLVYSKYCDLWGLRFKWLTKKYSAKAVYATYERLCSRGYAKPLSRAWNGEPTIKGRAALLAYQLNKQAEKALDDIKECDSIAYRSKCTGCLS